MIDADQIARARVVPIEEIAEQRGLMLRGNIERVGPCPHCGGRDRFSINAAKGVFYCRKCNIGGDGIALVMFLDDCSAAKAIKVLAGGHAPPPRQLPQSRPGVGPCRSNAAASDAWRRIWSQAFSPMGTVVEAYLRSRGLELPGEIAGSVLRFHPALWLDGKRSTGMVALFRDILTDHPCGIIRTFFDSRGRKLKRKMLGRSGGAAIKLSANEDVTGGLHLAEGFETALAGWYAGLRPVWALGSAGGIESFPVLPGVEAITVLGERNDGGANERAIKQLAARWLAAGPRFDLYAIDPLTGDDLADVWDTRHA